MLVDLLFSIRMTTTRIAGVPTASEQHMMNESTFCFFLSQNF